jgi:hypothetical protein
MPLILLPEKKEPGRVGYMNSWRLPGEYLVTTKSTLGAFFCRVNYRGG